MIPQAKIIKIGQNISTIYIEILKLILNKFSSELWVPKYTITVPIMEKYSKKGLRNKNAKK